MTVCRLSPRFALCRAFTLLELLVVIGVIAIMLVSLVPAVNSLAKSSGRKAAIGSLLGAAEQTRAHAIKTGRSAYVVFATFTAATPTTLEQYHFKSFAIFEEDPGSTGSPKQLTKWTKLPTGVSFRAQLGSAESVTDLPDAPTLTPPVAFVFTPETDATASFYCIKFNGNGELDAPANNVTLAVFEGRVIGATEVITGARDASGAPAARESIKVALLTGRAERTQ